MSAILSDCDRHDDMDDTAAWAHSKRQVVCCATLGCLGDCWQSRRPCKFPEAASAVSEFCAPEDDQSQSADLLVLKWMAVAAFKALGLVAASMLVWHGTFALCDWLKGL